MKVALIGAGKTGSEIAKLVPKEDLQVFDSSDKPTVEALRKADVIIVFVPGDALAPLLPLLVQSEKPVICGTTGGTWPEDLHERLSFLKITWVRGSNFSLGMGLVRRMLLLLSNSDRILPDSQFAIKETHHEQKQDAPSGTAKMWQKWLNRPVSITSKREGDIMGVHTLTVSTPHEIIEVEHEVLDRTVFALGALWAAHQVVSGAFSWPGLHEFHTLTDELLEARTQ